MIEVFKTDVNRTDQASILVERIQENFPGHRASFDLEDCDRVLRVQCVNGLLKPSLLIDLLHRAGFSAEVLPD